MVKKILSFLLLFSISVSLFAQNPPLNMTLEGTWDGAGENYNDIWGYVDDYDNEYAIIGSRAKVNFLDVTNPTNPVLIQSFFGGGNSSWRDIKIYDRYAYAVADQGSEGLIIFDLTDIHNGNISNVYQSNTHFTRAHNIYIDVAEARLYVLGSRKNGSLKDLIVYDLTTPDNPTLLKIFNNDELAGGYIHDAMVRDNIMYASSGNQGLFIFDLSNLNNVTLLGSVVTNGYNHSSWITDDSQEIIIAEEVPQGLPLLHYDISNLNNITQISSFKAPLESSSNNVTYHNPFIIDNYAIISSYFDGVTIFDISPGADTIVAHYDTYDNTGYSGYNGCWGTYPFLPSGNILASDIENGLFVISTTIPLTTECGNGILDHFEEDIDCGGFCHPCNPPEKIDMIKTSDVMQVSPGGIITYTLSATNNNSDTYHNVVISDPIPEYTTYVVGSASNGGSETGGIVSFPPVSLANGQSHTVTFQVKVDPTLISGSSFLDDVENGNTYWTATATNTALSNWVITNTNPNGGADHWFAENVASYNDQFLDLTNTPIVPSTTSELRFYHSYDTDENWDGGRVQISVSGGTWTDLGALMTQNGYNGILDNSSTPGFTGDSGGYIETVIDLSSFAKRNVQIRFFMHCDSGTGGDGWYIDDISVSNLEIGIRNIATVTADDAEDNTVALADPTFVLPATCIDAIQNGDETGIDCGGSSCSPCTGGGCPPTENYTGNVSSGIYTTSNWISSNGTITSTENVSFLSNEITLNPDFLVELGGVFIADIAPCTPFSSSNPSSILEKDYEYFDINFEGDINLEKIYELFFTKEKRNNFTPITYIIK